jgi:outer membrane protein assembly factor BamB
MHWFRRMIALAFVSGILPIAAPALGEASSVVASLWSVRLPGLFNSSVATPAIAANGTIYLGTFYGKFLAFSPAGQLDWVFEVNCEIKSSAAIADDGTVYFGSRNRKFYALTPAGRLKWLFATGGWVDSSPGIAADGTIYFGSDDGNFYALHPDGSLKWKFMTGAAVDSSPAIAADGTIYFGSHDKKIYALNSDGRLQWSFLTGGPVIASPAIAHDGTIYCASTDGNLYALNSPGTERWRIHTGGMTESSPVLDEEGNVYLGVNQLALEIVAPDGSFTRSCESPVLVDQTAAIATGRVYVTTPWRVLTALKTADRRAAWWTHTEANLSGSPALDAGGTLYFVCNLSLYAVRPPDGALPAKKSAWPQFRADPQHTGRVGG